MKKVTLTITGLHVHADVEDESIELVTEGKLYNRNGALYLLYDESELTGMTGLKTQLKLKNDSVCLTRKGKAVGVDTEIKFQKGEKYQGYYDTEFGPIEMEVLTNDLVNNVSEDGKGKVEIDYNISLKGLAEGRSKMNIEVKS